jgi:hypothetical protein
VDCGTAATGYAPVRILAGSPPRSACVNGIRRK